MNNFTIKKINDFDFYMAPHPVFNDFFTAIKYFNKMNDLIETGTLFIDLIILVGDSNNRFISAKVNNYKLDLNSIKVIKGNVELCEFAKKSYVELTDEQIKMVYPISYRNVILKEKHQSL